MRRIARYLICVLLIVFYLFTLSLSFFSNVPVEYKLYYVDKSLSNWPGYGGLSYDLGKRISFYGDSTNNYRGLGWSNQEKWGTWTDGSESTMYLDIKQHITSDLTLKFYAHSCVQPRNIKIVANGQNIAKVLVTMNDSELKLTVPKEVFQKSKLLELKFIIGEAKPLSELIDTSDSRKLGIGLIWMTLS